MVSNARGSSSVAAELAIADRVHFLGTRPDVPESAGDSSTCFLLTSLNEANPVSILEGLSCGKPVVATRVGSVPETVIDGENGYWWNREASMPWPAASSNSSAIRC